MQNADPSPPSAALLPPDDALREVLHNEVHARPPARIRLPALVVFVAVLNEGVTREAECEHLRRLPDQEGLEPAALRDNFLRLHFADHMLRWERHTEFTRYAVVQPLPEGFDESGVLSRLALPAGWLAGIPGRTVCAVSLAMTEHAAASTDAGAALALAQRWFGERTPIVASRTGNGQAVIATDLALQPDGFERMLVMAAPGTSEARAGRLSQRLLEIETYRLMALRGLPVAKDLAPLLAECESALAEVTAQLEARGASEAQLLDRLIHVAAGVERATAEHMYRFSATQAYDTLVRQRIAELREQPLPGMQTLGEFMQRRLSPAIATVAVSGQRLASLSQRIERASALLRTRVDIARETQNQQLLAKLTRGQALQLRLQATVEGLSIAAISYYVVSLLLYAGKAVKSAGLPIEPELAAGAAIPLVLWAVWKATQRVHRGLHDGVDGHA